MDLIATLSSQLGIDPEKAQGLAGAVLGQVEQRVGQQLGGSDAATLRSELPELDAWKAKAAALGGPGVSSAGGDAGSDARGAGGGLGGLLGAAAAALGGSGGAGGGGLGGLLGAAGGSLGGAGSGASAGFDVTSLLQIASKAGLGPSSVQQLVPIVVTFLKSRLDPSTLAKVFSAVPGLEKLGGGDKGGLLGMLGGIMGG